MPERGREGHRGRERVAARERVVGDEDTFDLDLAFQTPRDRLSQRILGRRGSEGDHGDGRAGTFGRELARLAHGPPAVRVELEVDTVAHQSTVGPELHLLEARDLLDEGGDAHQPTLQGCGVTTGGATVAEP